MTVFAKLSFLLLGYLRPPPYCIQLRNKLNQEQNAKLQQQRECLNKRNSEVAVMEKRVNELRDRLWKKKAALQQKENLPVSGQFWRGPGEGAGDDPPREVTTTAPSASLPSMPSRISSGILLFHVLAWVVG